MTHQGKHRQEDPNERNQEIRAWLWIVAVTMLCIAGMILVVTQF